MKDEERRAVELESTRCMIAGMEAMDRGDWQAAESFFGDAADLRDRLPWQDDAEAAWLVAAAWLNHGDVLIRTGEPERRREAIGSFDRAIQAMEVVPIGRNPAHVERLVLSWLNRAGACAEDGDPEGALAGYSAAESLLAKWGADVTPVRRFMTAMLRVNRARFFVTHGRALEAWREVGAGLDFLQVLEMTSETARAGIQARSIRCRALAMLLDAPGGAEAVGDWVAEATDSAEEALALVRTSGFRDGWVSDLVRYGALIYRRCQPQFLGEFLAEWLGENGPLADDADLKTEMRGVLLAAQLEVERKVLLVPQDTGFVEGQIRVLKGLQAGRAALG